ncbi:MAG: hypothetical protein QXN27_07120 [Archaeoglobaceae archaeon]
MIAVVYHWQRIPELLQRVIKVALSGKRSLCTLTCFRCYFNDAKEEYAGIYPPKRYRAMRLIHAGVLRAKAWEKLKELVEFLVQKSADVVLVGCKLGDPEMQKTLQIDIKPK